jgi:hypothetical protein
MCWVARYNPDGINEVPRVYTYNLTTNILSYFDVEFDIGSTFYYRATNPVIDSFGMPWIIFDTPNISTPTNYDIHLTTYNSTAGTINMKQVIGGSNTIILSNQIAQIDYNTLLIDSANNKYLCAYDGMYKVIDNTLTLLFTAIASPFRHAEYNISTDTFLVTDNNNHLLEFDLAGNILRDSGDLGSFAQEFATGGNLAQSIIIAQDGPPGFNIMPYFSDIFTGITIYYNYNNTIQGFVNGPQNVGEFTNFGSLVLKYDITDTDIYFIDSLYNLGV